MSVLNVIHYYIYIRSAKSIGKSSSYARVGCSHIIISIPKATELTLRLCKNVNKSVAIIYYSFSKVFK